MAIQTAYSLGARVFEKHFTLNKSLSGNDHYHSFSTLDCIEQIDSLRTLERMSRYSEENFIEIQTSARQFARRGLYASKPLMKGHIITERDLIALRPTYRPRGIDADSSSILINKKLAADHYAGQPMTLDSFVNNSI
jgi:N-acetylneuraminate synthase